MTCLPIRPLFMYVHKIELVNKPASSKMMGLFMPFFANNRRSKGGNIIEVDLDWLFHCHSSTCAHFINKT